MEPDGKLQTFMDLVKAGSDQYRQWAPYMNAAYPGMAGAVGGWPFYAAFAYPSVLDPSITENYIKRGRMD